MKKVLFLLLIIITIAGCVEKTDDLEKNASLKTLTLSTSGSSVLLNPLFSSEVTEYTAVLENEKDSLTVAAETSSAKASLEGTGNIMLSVGENNIKIIVTAENKSIKKEYNIKAMRKQKILDTNSELKQFAIVATGTSIVLTPNFTA